MPVWVTLSNGFGRRQIMLVVLTLFAVGAIVCGVANNYTVILVGRTIQGLGGGGLIGLTTVLITDMVPLRDRGRFYALISIVWAVGSTTGPIIGGSLAQKGQWRWIFWWVLSQVPLKTSRSPIKQDQPAYRRHWLRRPHLLPEALPP
jgi:MFS family permease